MPASSIHATAVAIGGEALLIRGPSRAGKSRLAAALIARSTQALPILLVGDDRILLSERGGDLVARPHPRIAGFLERRGLGIVAVDWISEARVGGVVELYAGRDLPSPAAGEGESQHVCHLVFDPSQDPDRVLAWWAGRDAAGASHSRGLERPGIRPRAKD